MALSCVQENLTVLPSASSAEVLLVLQDRACSTPLENNGSARGSGWVYTGISYDHINMEGKDD